MPLEKKLTIFDAILHCKNAWDAVSPETIVKCFRHSGVYDFNASPPCFPESTESTILQEQQDGDAEFDEYFENLLGIPWDKYLLMDEELEAEHPSCAPDANTCNDHVQDLPDQDQEPIEPMPSTQEVLNSLKIAQKYALGNAKLYELADQLIMGIQKMSIEQEVSNKIKQSTITSGLL